MSSIFMTKLGSFIRDRDPTGDFWILPASSSTSVSPIFGLNRVTPVAKHVTCMNRLHRFACSLGERSIRILIHTMTLCLC